MSVLLALLVVSVLPVASVVTVETLGKVGIAIIVHTDSSDCNGSIDICDISDLLTVKKNLCPANTDL